MIDGPRGLELLAARDLEQADELNRPSHDPARDARFAMVLPLEDEDGPIGQLLVGPRSDQNRYNAAQLDGLKALSEPLAESLRAALKARAGRGASLKLGTVEERWRDRAGGPRSARPERPLSGTREWLRGNTSPLQRSARFG